LTPPVAAATLPFVPEIEPIAGMSVSPSRGRSIGTAQVPVRRFGTVPPAPDEVLFLEGAQQEAPRASTIAERGALAVWLAALAAALVAGWLLYA